MEQYNYELPEAYIAKYPLKRRDQSKLLVWKDGQIRDERFSDLATQLPPKSLLVFNNTKVIRARLHFRKETGARIEIFVLDPIEPADYAQNFQQTQKCQWKCMVGNLKKWKGGALRLHVEIDNQNIQVNADNLGTRDNGQIIEFSWDNPNFTFSEILESAGNIPIPPYLNRESETSDLTRYQTLYSKIKGSVAAPTAGLHFTDEVFRKLQIAGMLTAELTLHVGAGTFQPVKSDTIGDHEMHTEHFLVQRSFIQNMLDHDGPVIAVGTTSIRTLESLYWLGVLILNNPNIPATDLLISQWDPYQINSTYSRQDSYKALLKYLDSNNLENLQSSTQIIIVPGYSFRIVDGMITNFHQPQSTLLLLISAFVGNDWKAIYKHALLNNYRFLSYGDSNLYLH